MKALNYFGSAVLALGLAIPALAQTAQDPQQQPAPSTSSQTTADPSQSRSQMQSFTGTVVKTSDGWMLQDETGKTSYKLDNEKMAKKYEGKSVKVTGTLDSSTNTIHISDVMKASTN